MSNKPSTQPTQHPTPADYKSQMQWRVTAVLAVCLLSFLVFFIPAGIQEKIASKFGEFQQYSGLVLGVAGSPFIFLMRWVIFAQDHLATGASKASLFFRYFYPSRVLRATHAVGENEANRMWFEFYNKWQKPNHAHHDLFKRNSERTYSLRMTWYLQRILFAYCALALLAMSLDCWLFDRKTFTALAPAKCTLLAVAIAGWLWVKSSNTFTDQPNPSTYFAKYSATGAYEKYREIQGYVWELFNADIVEKWVKAQQKKTKGAAGKTTGQP